MLPPRPVLAACLLLLGGLAWSVNAGSAPRVALAEAGLWDGQTIRVEGWAQQVTLSATGTLRLRLTDAHHLLQVRVPGTADVGEGDRIEVTGRVARGTGGLTLFADGGDAVRRLAQPEPERPSWDAMAAAPDEWAGRRIELTGTVARGSFSADGVVLRTGEGPWPRGGLVVARGLLRYEPDCVCHVLDADEVRPWTP